MNGDSFMVNVETNKKAERNGHIWLVGRDYGGFDVVSDAIGIVQEKFIYPDPVLTIAPTTGTIDHNGGEMTFNVQTENVNDVRFVSNSEWITGTVEGNLLKINVAVNSGDERSGNIWLEAIDLGDNEVKSNEVAITQEKYVEVKSVLKYTTTDSSAWDSNIKAYTTNDRFIEPLTQDATGWTYDNEVRYVKADESYFPQKHNLLTFNGFGNKVKYKDCSKIFLGERHCTSINTTNIDVSECTNMRYVFSDCNGLTSLDVSNWDTSKVITMNSMFSGCIGLTSLDVSHFDTSKVTDMSLMFAGCNGLTSLDVSHFDTSQVVNMSGMFYNCSNLTSLDVSNFNTSRVTDMSLMFTDCSSLTSLDVSSFNTVKVREMVGMFSDCSRLTSLNLSNWDTSQVTVMNRMFDGCNNLTSLDISNWNTVNVSDMSNMFNSCWRLTSLNLSNWNTSQVTNMNSMFFYCYDLTSLDLSNWNTANVSDMRYMFKKCTALKTITMKNCSQETVDKIKAALAADNITGVEIIQ